MTKIWTVADFPECMTDELREEAARAFNAPRSVACHVTENSDNGWGWGLPEFPPVKRRSMQAKVATAEEGAHV
ncbi:MAG: hypothetical protein HQM01_01685 [Magnetococcales bacterium]|nr:hypothetical protein [Magnetococcales bacterium]